ncbi:hypothetical protein [Cellulomonas sp. P5_C6]
MRTGSTTGRPRRLTRAGAVAVLTWVLAVVVGSAIAWRALAVVDSGERTGVLSQAEVVDALSQAQAPVTPSPSATTPAPGPTSTPTPTPALVPTPTPTATSTPVPAPTRTTAPTPAAPAIVEVARTWTVPGGIVAVTCNGAAITLLYATPSDGWTVEVGATGPERVDVELHRDKAETKLTGTCVAGAPEPQIDSEVDGSGSGSDDRRSARVSPSPGADD